MKKVAALLLVASLILFCACGCENDKHDDTGDGRIVLTLGGRQMQLAREVVNKFNNENKKYRIELYHEKYNVPLLNEDFMNESELALMMITGDAPDIIEFGSYPTDAYAEAGAIEDLYPYIDNDPDLDREDFLPSVLEALEINGGLYECINGFGIDTWIANGRHMKGDSWTLEDMKNYIISFDDKAAILEDNSTGSNLLLYLMFFYGNEYVDLETKTCGFENENFTELLQFCKEQSRITEPIEEDPYRNVRLEMFADSELAFSRQIISAAVLKNLQNYIDVGGKIVGYPTVDGVGGSLFFTLLSFAMNSKSEHKEGVWEFMKMYFTKKSDIYFPVLADSFEAFMESPTVPDPMYTEGIRQETIDAVRKAIENAKEFHKSDGQIFEIIMEESERFFNGDKTADEAAKIIQSRVNIYINE